MVLMIFRKKYSNKFWMLLKKKIFLRSRKTFFTPTHIAHTPIIIFSLLFFILFLTNVIIFSVH